MLLQQDSIVQEQAVEVEEQTVTSENAKPQHPYQVLRLLPKDATPAQQDSAIQATFQPKEIRYSDRPDTLHLPGSDVGKSIMDVTLPKYYKESFFSKDTLLHPELNGGRYGVPGDPVPYTVRADNIITILLIACFILAVVAFGKSQRFILRQTKGFFYVPRRDDTNVTETYNEVRFQFFLVLQTCLLFSLLQYFYTKNYISETFILSSQYQLIVIYFAMYASYFLVKGLLYTFVNAVFFGSRKNMQWMKTLLFITSMEGIMLFPVVLLLVYFDLSMQSVVSYVIIVLILVKMLTFYKCYIIFFRRIDAFLQIILYFCALEMIPLVAFWGALVITGDYLKVNF